MCQVQKYLLHHHLYTTDRHNLHQHLYAILMPYMYHVYTYTVRVHMHSVHLHVHGVIYMYEGRKGTKPQCTMYVHVHVYTCIYLHVHVHVYTQRTSTCTCKRVKTFTRHCLVLYHNVLVLWAETKPTSNTAHRHTNKKRFIVTTPTPVFSSVGIRKLHFREYSPPIHSILFSGKNSRAKSQRQNSDASFNEQTGVLFRIVGRSRSYIRA